jgi:hypothetical protein
MSHVQTERGGRSRARGLVAALLVTTVVALAGGAGAGAATPASVTPKAWGSAFCTTLVDWRDAVQALEAQYSPQIKAATSVQGALGSLEAFLTAAAAATDTAARSQAAAGAPRVPNGAAIQKVFVNAYRHVAKAFRTSAARAAKVDGSSALVVARVKRIQARVEAIKGEFNDSVGEVKRLDRHDRLSKKLETLPACSAIAAG